MTQQEAERSMEDTRGMVIAAIHDYFGAQDVQVYPVATFGDHVIVGEGGYEWDGGRYFSISYAIVDESVVLGAPEQVEMTFAKVTEALSGLVEAVEGADGREWEVVLIKAGVSANGNLYTKEALKAAIPLFEGVKAYADHPTPSEARERPERSIKDVVGWFEEIRYQDGEIRALFKVSESADWLRIMIRDAYERGKKDLVGFSIRADAEGRRGTVGESARFVVAKFTKISSVDVVTTPAAGGEVVELVASDRSGVAQSQDIEVIMDNTKIEQLEGEVAGVKTTLDEIKESLAALAKPVETSDAHIEGEVQQVEEQAEVSDASDTQMPAIDVAEELRKLQETTQQIAHERNQLMVHSKIAESELPSPSKDRLRADLSRREYSLEEVEEAIGRERDFWAQSLNAGLVTGLGKPTQVGANDVEKKMARIDAMFSVDGTSKVGDQTVSAYSGFKEAYCDWHGIGYWDARPHAIFESLKAGGYDSELHHERLQESLSTTSWGQVFADVLYNRLQKEYVEPDRYDDWRQVVSNIDSATDFRTKHVTRVGDYSDLGTVSEQATYPTMTSPGDEEATYAVQKRGGIDDITMEMIADDKIGSVRKLPARMATAAKRTLYKFVFNTLIQANPTLDQDSVALFNAAHSNTGTTALSVGGVSASVTAMRSQTGFGGNDVLGASNKPALLLVPNELEMLAQRIANPSDAYLHQATADTDASDDPASYRGKLKVIVVDDWTDATDWFLVADPSRIETIEISFFNGRQAPELFVQDQATVGSVFTADKISYKIRHIYGGDVIDFRGFYRQVVA